MLRWVPSAHHSIVAIVLSQFGLRRMRVDYPFQLLIKSSKFYLNYTESNAYDHDEIYISVIHVIIMQFAIFTI